MKRKSASSSRAVLPLLGGAALLFGACLFLVFNLSGCGKKNEAEKTPAEKGRAIYAVHCTACHSSSPDRDGSLGPALVGSSLELIEARVLRGEYPPGYAPKRQTHIMQPLPLTQEEVESLHAYLNSL